MLAIVVPDPDITAYARSVANLYGIGTHDLQPGVYAYILAETEYGILENLNVRARTDISIPLNFKSPTIIHKQACLKPRISVFLYSKTESAAAD